MDRLSLFTSLVLPSSLELSDTKVYDPQIRALLGTASQFCEVVVLKSKTVTNGTTLSLRIDTGIHLRFRKFALDAAQNGLGGAARLAGS